MEIIQGTGKLTHPETRERLAEVSYIINYHPPSKMRFGEWSGKLIIRSRYDQSWDLFDELGKDLKLELDDGRSGRIIVTNWSPLSPNSLVWFTGNGALKQDSEEQNGIAEDK